MRSVFTIAPALVLALAAPAFPQGAPGSRPATTASPAAVSAPAAPDALGAQQQLYVHDFVGDVYRIDDYATNPTAVRVANTGLGRTSDIAFDPARHLFSCSFGPYPLTRFHAYDAAFQPTLVTSNLTMDWANALDIAADGTVWVRSANANLLWILDPVTGAALIATATDRPAAGDLAVDVDGSVLGVDDLGRVDRFDPTTGAATVLGPHGLGSDVWGFEIDRDGTGYLFTSAGDLYALDLATLTTSFVGSTGVTVGGCAFLLPANTGGIVGQDECLPAVPNSTGRPGAIVATGSAAVADGDLTFVLSGLPGGSAGFLLASRTTAFRPHPRGSQGILCLAGLLEGVPFVAGADGIARLTLDLAATTIQPGETWHFQAWYHDRNPSPTSNFTYGTSVAFQ
jgi:hypothetical protein